MSTAVADNLTNFQAGGSGDNIVADGYIKTVEKVWIDSYTIGFTDTNCTLSIAELPANKKITSLDFEIYSTVSQTNGTVSLGFSTDSAVDTLLAPVALTHNLTRTSIAFPGGLTSISAGGGATIAPGVLAGYQLVTSGTQVTVALKLNNWTMTTGTVKSIVRYT